VQRRAAGSAIRLANGGVRDQKGVQAPVCRTAHPAGQDGAWLLPGAGDAGLSKPVLIRQPAHRHRTLPGIFQDLPFGIMIRSGVDPKSTHQYYIYIYR